MNEPVWWAVTLIVPCVAIVGYWWIARRQMRAATADLEAALERQRRIVAQVSHRLRNPLTVIYGFTETLVDPSILDDRDEVASVAAMVNAEALDVSRTVEDLVAAQEVDRGEFVGRSAGFDPSEEIDRVVTPFRRLGSPISVEAWSGTAISDPLRFRHVLQTLVSNAVRHGGAEISIFADLDGDWYRCTVADDGPGLPESTAEALFGTHRDPSSETSPDESLGNNGRASHTPGSGTAIEIDTSGRDGLGLGLAVATRVARHLNGELTYQRAPAFTAFTLSLPTTAWPGPLIPLIPIPGPTIDDDTHDDHEDAASNEAASLPHEPTVSFGPESNETSGSDSNGDGGDASFERRDEDAVRS
mgnify:CR=1 FL=1